MIDLTHEMTELLSSLGQNPDSSGRIVMFMAAHQGEGVSTISREFARCAAAMASRPVWLIDADLDHQTQLAEIAKASHRFGPPGPLSQASPDGSAFFAITPPARDREGRIIPDARFVVARPFLDNRLWVSRFRDLNLKKGQRVSLFDQTSYWKAIRRHAQTVIVDAPSREVSRDGLALAPLVDAIILVVSEDMGEVESRMRLKSELETVGGRVIGLVYNRAREVTQHRRDTPKARAAL